MKKVKNQIPTPNLILDFKSFKIARSNFKDWQLYGERDHNQLESLFDDFETPLKEDWKPENLLIEVMLLQGYPLDSSIDLVENSANNFVVRVYSDTVEQEMIVSLDEKIDDKTIKQLHLRSEDIFVCLDNALSDEAKISLADQTNLKVI